MTQALQQIQDKYEVLRLLGEGGMGEVYLVRHRLLEDLRVVKIMHASLQEDSELRERFVREAKAAVQLKHPNIAQVHDFWIDDSGDAFLVMEYIEGMNLHEMLKRLGAPELDLAIDIARQTLRALGYLHSKHFVHRDVSPDNLMLTRDVDDRPLIKLIDLGLAKELVADVNLTHEGCFLGKVHYASPEQFEPSAEGGDIDGRSDLYSFGIVLYLLLTGKYPIQGGSGSALIAGHLLMPPMSFEEADPNHRIPEPIRAIVRKSLEKKPADRFATAGEFIRALDSEIGGRSLSGVGSFESSIPVTVIQDLTRIRESRIALEVGPTRPLGLEKSRDAIEEQEPAELDEATVVTPPEEVREAPASEGVGDRAEEPTLAGSQSGSNRLWLAMASVLVILIAVTLWTTSGRQGEPAREVMASKEQGHLALDVIPWARVVEVRDEDGEIIAVQTGDRSTPLVLDLEPGNYEILLENDSSGESKSLAVQIAAGETLKRVVELTPVDVDAYLAGLKR